MIAFEVSSSGTRLCKAGIGADGVLTAAVTLAVSQAKRGGKDELFVQVSGLHSPSQEHRHWTFQPLKVGDEISIRVVSATRIEAPRSRSRDSANKVLRGKKEYVRRVAKELGWSVKERSK